jgi:hypothetical protein
VTLSDCPHPTAVQRRVGTARCWLLLVVALAGGCTTIGAHDPTALARLDLGPPVAVSLCAYLDEGITAEEVASLLDVAWRDEGPGYGVTIRIVRAVHWKRPAFGKDGILTALAREQLHPPCDRIMAFLGRHPGDVLWGLFLPQVLGATALTHGYVVARAASLDQLVAPPAVVLRHELHHLLGCEHGLTMTACYARIAALKAASQGEFFPAWSRALNRVVGSREEANRLLGG